MKLSKRLEMVASFVPQGSKVADIGTDHGYVPIYLVSHGIADSAVAVDVKAGPLRRAAAHVKEAGLFEHISIRLSDGLEKLEAGEADCAVIAGMGGELMIHIMEEGRRLWRDMGCWVLSPQSEQEKVRRFLIDRHFSIDRDCMLKDDGKYYTVMAASGGRRAEEAPDTDGLVRRGSLDWKEAHYRYGQIPIRQKDPILMEYLEKEEMQLKQILRTLEHGKTPKAIGRCRELQGKLLRNKEAQNEMQRSDTEA